MLSIFRSIILLVVTAILLAVSGCHYLSAPVTLTYSTGGELTENEKRIFHEFELANPGVKIEPVKFKVLSGMPQHDAYVTYLSTGGSTVDVFSIDIVWMAEFAASGWILPLDPWFTEPERDAFIPSVLAGGIYDGKLYGLPGVADVGLYFYNRKKIRNTGKIKNWKELFRASRPFGRKAMIYQASRGEALICNLLEFFPGDFKEENRLSDYVTKYRKQWQKALKLYKQPVKARLTPKNILAFDESMSEKTFLKGDHTFLRNWPYMIQRFRQAGWKWGRDVDLLFLPDRPVLGGWYTVVNRRTEHPETAVKLLKFLVSKKVQQKQFSTGWNYPTLSSFYTDKKTIAAKPELPAIYSRISRAKTRPRHPRYYEFSKVVSWHVHRYLGSNRKAAATLDAITRDLQQLEEGDPK